MKLEPRWDEITVAVIRSLEGAIAIEQDKFILARVQENSVADEQAVKDADEPDVEFAQRVLRMEQQKKGMQYEREVREKRLKLLINEYVDFLQQIQGKPSVAGEPYSFLAEQVVKSGAMDKVPALLVAKDDKTCSH